MSEQYMPKTFQAVIAAGHTQRFRYGLKAGIGVQRERPQHRMHEHEQQASGPQTEPSEEVFLELKSYLDASDQNGVSPSIVVRYIFLRR